MTDLANGASGQTPSFLKRARHRALDAHPSAGDFANIYYSGTTLALWRCAQPVTSRHAAGLVLDAGSGRGGWRTVIEAAGARREALDIAQAPGRELDWVADLTAMPQVPPGRFDCVVCHQVLEHVPRPHLALAEIARVLKPDGTLVLSVPHLSRLHELPHDYFRYTRNGLVLLIEDAGLEVVDLRHYGGILTFLHHQLSTLLLGLASFTGSLYPAFVALNAPLSLASAGLDSLLDPRGLAANGYVAVARKPATAGADDG